MTLRTVLKRAIGSAALAPGFRRKTDRGLRSRLNVVYLHYVGENTSYYADFYCGSTLERLDRDLELLGRYFEFRPLEQLVRSGAGNGLTDAPRLAVTFDDGFDLLSNGAVDVLENHGVSATSFVVRSIKAIGPHMLVPHNRPASAAQAADASRKVPRPEAVSSDRTVPSDWATARTGSIRHRPPHPR